MTGQDIYGKTQCMAIFEKEGERDSGNAGKLKILRLQGRSLFSVLSEAAPLISELILVL